MRKVIILSILFLASLAIGNKVAQAHPGNTDSSGGHTCYTNCSSWGLSYGQYHYHNGNSTPSLPSYTYPSPTPPSYTIPTYTPSITVKSFVVSNVIGYDKLLIADSYNDYLITTGFGCGSYSFYSGQTIYIDTYYTPQLLNDIYTSKDVSSKKCSIISSKTLTLKPYYVIDVLDNTDKIIVNDANLNKYLVEYGIGCLSMWRYEGKTIQIDIGGSFLDGISDEIYLFDSDDNCRVWDADEIKPSYSPITAPPSNITTCPLNSTLVNGSCYCMEGYITNSDKSQCILKPNSPTALPLPLITTPPPSFAPELTPPPLPTKLIITTLLKQGMSGKEVERLQEILLNKGFLKAPKNFKKGYFGPLTTTALKKYQKSYKLRQSGKLDEQTKTILNSEE